MDLPDGLQPKDSVLLQGHESTVAQVLLSEDCDYTVAVLKKKYPDCKVIDISEYDASDLLSSIGAEVDAEQGHFHFTETRKVLYQSLLKGERVILKGHFSPELLDNLSPLCVPGACWYHNGKAVHFPGELVLVSEQREAFSFSGAEHIKRPGRDELKKHSTGC